MPVCISSGRPRSPGPPLQHRGPLKPSAATARGARWCATDVFTVRFQTAAFPFFRLFFLYLSSPWGRLTAHNPGGGSLRESPCTERRGRPAGSTCSCRGGLASAGCSKPGHRGPQARPRADKPTYLQLFLKWPREKMEKRLRWGSVRLGTLYGGRSRALPRGHTVQIAFTPLLARKWALGIKISSHISDVSSWRSVHTHLPAAATSPPCSPLCRDLSRTDRKCFDCR